MKTVTYDETRFVLVPIEPTREMLDAGRYALLESMGSMGSRNETEDCYDAMLAAAPSEGESDE